MCWWRGTVYHMQDIKTKVITYKCLNKNFPVICPPHLQHLSRDRVCLCDKSLPSTIRFNCAESAYSGHGKVNKYGMNCFPKYGQKLEKKWRFPLYEIFFTSSGYFWGIFWRFVYVLHCIQSANFTQSPSKKNVLNNSYLEFCRLELKSKSLQRKVDPVTINFRQRNFFIVSKFLFAI